MRSLNSNEIRLIKYSRLIDEAIVAKRYGLATHLAYRCLLEYHRLFIRFTLPNYVLVKKNAFQLSIEAVKYLHGKTGFWQFRRSGQLFQLVRTTYHLTTLSTLKYGDRDAHIDRATAEFARDQSIAISKLLIAYIK